MRAATEYKIVVAGLIGVHLLVVVTGLSGVHKIHGRVNPNSGLAAILLVVMGLPTLASS